MIKFTRHGKVVCLMVLCGILMPLVTCAEEQKLDNLDEIRAQEAFRLIDRYGNRVWQGWNSRQIAVCLETEKIEFLLFHSSPPVQRVETSGKRPNFSGYTFVEKSAILDTDIYQKPLTLPFPAATLIPIGGIPTLLFPTKNTVETKLLKDDSKPAKLYKAMNFIDDQRG